MFETGAALAFALVAAGTPLDEWSAWDHQQRVRTDEAGLARIDLGLATLDAARADLADLRLIDTDGHEVPYAIRRPSKTPSRLADADVTVRAEHDLTVLRIDTRTSEPIAAVRLRTPAPEWIKTARVEGRRDGGRWQPIVAGVRIFRLLDGAADLEIELVDDHRDAVAWSRLRVALDDRRSGPIPVVGARLVLAASDSPAEETHPTVIIERSERPHESRLRLRLPAHNLRVAAVTLETEEPLFTRRVQLLARSIVDGEIRERRLQDGTLFRVAIGQESCDRVRLDIDQPVAERELVLVIQGGHGAPLSIDGVTVHLLPTELLFHRSAASDLRLLVGNPAASTARYDIASLVDRIGQPTVTAASDPLATNPSYVAGDGPNEIPLVAGAMPENGWRWRKLVRVHSPGAQSLELDLAVLAHAAPDQRDLRVARGRQQVPYVIDRTPRTRVLDVTPDPIAADSPRASRFKLALPRSGLPITHLTCTASDPLFRRAVVLDGERADRRGATRPVRLAQATWTRRPGDHRKPLSLALSGRRIATDRLLLEIDDGDNPPLELTSCELHVRTARLLFRASPGADLWLHYGNPHVSAPRYDVALIADRLLDARPQRATLDVEIEHAPPRWWSADADAPGIWLWLSLGAAVVVFLVVIARLLPTPSPDAGRPPTTGES